ncbi:hypothetical protein AG0111_0g10416 [Alternaria gaisen]|uniref:Uncharacterized protein n=1 Tax=Alternaria gaisen TaxID=167740 RepID=A0ACB6FAX9_9PLEO|nr:hypothetical protein AG0111_0g10416 [Alternaria gaisen]
MAKEAACANLGINDEIHHRTNGLRLNIELEFYQPTAINALVEFEDSMSVGLLADDAGLGNTVEVIYILLYRSNSCRKAHEDGQPPDQQSLLWYCHGFETVMLLGTIGIVPRSARHVVTAAFNSTPTSRSVD